MKNPIDYKDLTYKQLDRVAPLFLKYSWEDKDSYARFLSNKYYIISQSCRLLAAAASRCNMNYDNFFHRFIAHASEERNHEKLILNDLKDLGVKLMPQMSCMAPIWQFQFYQIDHISPLSLFGYILYFENLSVHRDIGPYVYECTLRKFGKKATSFLRVHVEEDVEHVETLFKMLESLSEGEAKNVMNSLESTASLYEKFMIDLADSKISVNMAA